MSLAKKYVGIINQGSTCYLNSVIQTLYHLPFFRRMIFSLKAKEDSPVLHALRNLFAQLEAGTPGITTTELTDAFGWDSREAAVQHDVHELIQQLFDSIETIVKGSHEETFIRDLFGGQLIYRSQAVDGASYISDRLEGFYDLELVVKERNDMLESLKGLVSPDKIDGVSIELAPGAAPTKHNIERSLRLHKLPPVLLIHPNRVAFNMETFEPMTLGNRWEFGTSLDLAPYMTDGMGLKLDKESTQKLDKLNASSGAVPKRDCLTQYELRSVLVHAGDATVGHYFVFVRFPNEEWVCFNDDQVEAANVEDVERASFGGNSKGWGRNSQYHSFDSERASVLVYVNRAYMDVVLHEDPAPESVLALAKKIEHERTERWNSVSYNFFLGDESFVDVLEHVPGAAERLVRTVKVSSSASLGDVTKAIGAQVGASPSLIKLAACPVRFGYGHRYYLAEVVPEKVQRDCTTVLDEAEGKTVDAFVYGFLRVYRSPTQVDGPYVFHCVSELKKRVPKGCALYGCRAKPVSVAPVNYVEDIPWGTGVIAAAPSVSANELVGYLSKRQFRKTEVFLADPKNPFSSERVFSLTVDDNTTYTDLQGGVYDIFKANAKLAAKLPPSEEYIGFYYTNEHTPTPCAECLAPMQVQWSGDGSRSETTAAVLCGRGIHRHLYFSFLPKPMKTINYGIGLLLRLGWAGMPRVYFTWDQSEVTFAKILEEAINQIGEDVPAPLRKRYDARRTSPHSGSGAQDCPARLIGVDKGQIEFSTMDWDEKVNLVDFRVTYVIDPLPPVMTGFKVVDVLFCSRRKGEDYFGYPTAISVSEDMTELGSALLLRVGKKLNVPDVQVSTKRWLLYVKKVNTKNIKLCDAKSDLASVVTQVGGGEFELLIDRPIVPELDGLTTPSVPNQDGGIVIKSASATDLSAL